VKTRRDTIYCKFEIDLSKRFGSFSIFNQNEIVFWRKAKNTKMRFCFLGFGRPIGRKKTKNYNKKLFWFLFLVDQLHRP
jgi:hypothetical protein